MNFLTKCTLSSVVFLLSGCTNISIGFEKDSPFYNGDFFSTKEERIKKIQGKEKVITKANSTPALTKKSKVIQKIDTTVLLPKQDLSQEVEDEEGGNKTTFYYDKYAGE